MVNRSRWLFLPLAVFASLALAQSSGGAFVLTRTTTDSGGGYTSGGTFEMKGTIAQPNAQPQMSVGGEFIVAGGIWANASDRVFVDGYES
jgi:hypothetical protein